jgi:hypothetical protein
VRAGKRKLEVIEPRNGLKRLKPILSWRKQAIFHRPLCKGYEIQPGSENLASTRSTTAEQERSRVLL